MKLLPTDVSFDPHQYLSRQWMKSHKAISVGVVCLLGWALFAVIAGVKAIASHTPYDLSGWGGLFRLVAILIFGWMFLRWVVRKMVWRLRNRLMVTYIFIGVVPIFLLVLIGLITLTLFSGQFAAQTVRNRFAPEVANVDISTAVAGTEASRSGVFDVNIAQAAFRKQIPNGELEVQTTLPSWAKGEFSGLVFDNGKLYLRALRTFGTGSKATTVVASVPVDDAMFAKILEGIGTGELKLVKGLDIAAERDRKAKKDAKGDEKKRRTGITISTDDAEKDQNRALEQAGFGVVQMLKAGTLPPKRMRWDPDFSYSTVLPATDWTTGEQEVVTADGQRSTLAMYVTTRPSALYDELFKTTATVSKGIGTALLIVCIVFGVIEVIALIIGIRLTRSITGAVAKLYKGTQRVNKGDFSCCIEVKSNDQLAELEKSFNNMTRSLDRLIAEQKEKQRMESELAIAQEVQAQLFPHEVQPIGGLDLHGLCLPARTVSGDYYDFVPLDEENLLIALGDISGKGISAALLMATLHSAVRSYDLRRLVLPAVLGASVSTDGTCAPSFAQQCCVSGFMETLNTQLYRSTPSSKYATLFLGAYNARASTMTYCNGGHLPPIIVTSNGAVRRLEEGGMVVGLMDRMTYAQSTVEFRTGDLFISFTDGITEPEDIHGDEFGDDRLVELIQANSSLELNELASLITDEVKRWIGNAEQPDDMTLVLARAR